METTSFILAGFGPPKPKYDTDVAEEAQEKRKIEREPPMVSSRIVSRFSSRLRSLSLNSNRTSPASEFCPLKSTSRSDTSLPARRISRISRLPLQLSSIESMMPLHSAVASARLVSSLSIESQSWGLVPNGISMPF